MVKENNLSVFFTYDFFAGCAITGVCNFRVNVNHLAITEVTELKAEFGVRV